MNIEQALEKFQVQLEADGRSIHTRQQYQRHIALFSHWAHEVGHSGEISEISHETIAAFLASPTARTRASGGLKRASSLNCMRSSIKGFFAYATEAGFVPKDPSRMVRPARCGTSPPRGLSEGDQRKLMETLVEGVGYEARRDHAMFHLMLATGIRLGSVVALDTQDVDIEAGEIWLRVAKGDRPERVYLAQKIQEHLRDYLGNRHPGPLFSDRDGLRLTTRQIQRRFQFWLKKAGIQRHVSVHGLRHSFASHLYDRTHDLLLVQRALRHRSICSTLVYARTDETRLRQILNS